MFLWMLEEFVYILEHLCEEDRERCMVLGHELLLLACSRCCSKRGGGRGSCTAPLCSPLDILPACSPDTLDHTMYGHPRTLHLRNTSRGWYMIISWHPDNHCLYLASNVMTKWMQCIWWTRHTKDYMPNAQCTHISGIQAHGEIEISGNGSMEIP